MRFEKFEALGNDFIIVRETEAGDSPDFSQLALRLCDRHFGVGADGACITAMAVKLPFPVMELARLLRGYSSAKYGQDQACE